MITALELRERLQYDPNTGRWVWLKTPRAGYEGKPAGSLDAKGYWVNLRPATRVENLLNREHNGVLGIPGVRKHSHNNSYTAQHDNIYIGSYKTIDEAIAAREAFINERKVS